MHNALYKYYNIDLNNKHIIEKEIIFLKRYYMKFLPKKI